MKNGLASCPSCKITFDLFATGQVFYLVFWNLALVKPNHYMLSIYCTVDATWSKSASNCRPYSTIFFESDYWSYFKWKSRDGIEISKYCFLRPPLKGETSRITSRRVKQQHLKFNWCMWTVLRTILYFSASNPCSTAVGAYISTLRGPKVALLICFVKILFCNM
jgi:hypothetical protein